MKTWIHYLAPTFALTLALPVGRAAEDEKPQAKDKKSSLRVLAAPDRDSRVWVQRGDKMEKENVTFLGVEASPAPAALAAQLGLARGTGLVVSQVAPKSAADGVLQQHDILLKLDDQILIEPHQLSVLIRNHKEGDEVTLTYIRGGKQATAKVKLTMHEVPKVSALDGNISRAFSYATGTTGDGRFEMHVKRPDGLEGEEWNRVLSLLQRSRGAPDGPAGSVPPGARIRIDHGSGPGFRAMSINTGNSNLAYSDDEGSLDLTMKDGTKLLVAKNAKGEQVFAGPVGTPDERKALPPNVRERLEKLEGMHDITFRTDGDFKGAEMRIMPFPPKEISLPGALRTPRAGRPPTFF
jgi:serine protease Do